MDEGVDEGVDEEGVLVTYALRGRDDLTGDVTFDKAGILTSGIEPFGGAAVGLCDGTEGTDNEGTEDVGGTVDEEAAMAGEGTSLAWK